MRCAIASLMLVCGSLASAVASETPISGEPTLVLPYWFQFLTHEEQARIIGGAMELQSLRSQAFADQPGRAGRPEWMAMTTEERLEHLRSIALKSAGGLRIATRVGLMWLEPVVGESYVAALAEEVAALPQGLLDAAPAQLESAKRIVTRMGMDGERVDGLVNRAGTIFIESMNRLSDPSFISDALRPIDE